MNAKTGINTDLKKYLVRGVAALFLLFISADFALPQSCAADGGVLSLEGSVAVNSPRACSARPISVAALGGSHATGQEQQPGQMPPQEQHCISGCIHVLPGVISAHMVYYAPVAVTFDLPRDSLPSAPPQSLYRPPRHA